MQVVIITVKKQNQNQQVNKCKKKPQTKQNDISKQFAEINNSKKDLGPGFSDWLVTTDYKLMFY